MSSSDVTVDTSEMELRNVLVGAAEELGRTLSLMGGVAVAYTMGSWAVNLRSSMAQHVVFIEARDDHPLKPFSPTYAQHHDSGRRQLKMRPVFLVGSAGVSTEACDRRGPAWSRTHRWARSISDMLGRSTSCRYRRFESTSYLTRSLLRFCTCRS